MASINEDKRLTRINRWEMARYDGSEVEMTLTAAFDSAGHDRLAVTLGAKCRAIRGAIARPLMDYFIRVVFDVADAGERVMVTPNAVYIPPRILGVIMGVGVGALRGMMAARTAGTRLAARPLPVFSLEKLLASMGGAQGVPSMPTIEFSMTS